MELKGNDFHWRGLEKFGLHLKTGWLSYCLTACMPVHLSFCEVWFLLCYASGNRALSFTRFVVVKHLSYSLLADVRSSRGGFVEINIGRTFEITISINLVWILPVLEVGHFD